MSFRKNKKQSSFFFILQNNFEEKIFQAFFFFFFSNKRGVGWGEINFTGFFSKWHKCYFYFFSLLSLVFSFRVGWKDMQYLKNSHLSVSRWVIKVFTDYFDRNSTLKKEEKKKSFYLNSDWFFLSFFFFFKMWCNKS